MSRKPAKNGAKPLRTVDGVTELPEGEEQILICTATNKQVRHQVDDSDIFYVSRKLRKCGLKAGPFLLYAWLSTLPQRWRFSSEGTGTVFSAHPKTIGRWMRKLESYGLAARGQFYEVYDDGRSGWGRAMWVRFEQPVTGEVAERVLRGLGCKKMITKIEDMPATMDEAFAADELVELGALMSAPAEARKQALMMATIAPRKTGKVNAADVERRAEEILGSKVAAALFMRLWESTPETKRFGAGHKHNIEAVKALAALLDEGYSSSEIEATYRAYLSDYESQDRHREPDGSVNYQFMRQLQVVLQKNLPAALAENRAAARAEQRRLERMEAARAEAERKEAERSVLSADAEYMALKGAYEEKVAALRTAGEGLKGALKLRSALDEAKRAMDARAAAVFATAAAPVRA